MGQLATELRQADFNDIIEFLEYVKWFRWYEAKYYYVTNAVNMGETIKLLNDRVQVMVKEYEKRWNMKLPMGLVRRVVKG